MFASFKAVARWKEQASLASFSVISWIVVMAALEATIHQSHETTPNRRTKVHEIE